MYGVLAVVVHPTLSSWSQSFTFLYEEAEVQVSFPANWIQMYCT